MQQRFSHRIHRSTERMLHLSSMPQAIPGCTYVDSCHKEQGNNSNRYCQRKAGLLTTKHDITNVVLEMHNQHQSSMHNDKERESDQAQKMQAASNLTPSKELDIPGKTSLDRW